MLSDERIRQIAEDIYCSEGTRAEIEHSIRAALAEAAQSPALTELAAEYEQRITDLEDVLRSLACSLSAGGYNADTVDSTVFEKKIRDGIDMLIAPLRERIRQLEALMVPGGFPSDVITAAGLVYHGKRDKVLAERLRIGAQSMLAAAIAGEGEKK